MSDNKEETTIHYRPDGKTPLKKVIKKQTKTDVSYSAPCGTAAEKYLQRSLLRNKKLEKDDGELERTPSPLVTVMNEDGNPEVPFTHLHITFGEDKIVRVEKDGPGD